jgi:hypothetical protein
MRPRSSYIRAGKIISDPVIGFLSYDNKFSGMRDQDSVGFKALFSEMKISENDDIPKCDVLFLYADIQEDGHLHGAGILTIGNIAQAAEASVLVLASENVNENLIAAAKNDGSYGAGFVYTYKRGNTEFTQFFLDLFGLMFKGETMPMAWVTLFPQNPHAQQPELPAVIFTMEGGAVTFTQAN